MKHLILLMLFLILYTTTDAATEVADTTKKSRVKNLQKVQYGVASYYNSKFQGRPTASGDLYDEKLLTAAHNSLPFNTIVRVTHLKNKRSIIVRINDRLHYRNTRVIDLSREAASSLGIISKGLAKVKVEILDKDDPEEL